jgi:acyl-coenzyme A thioesterase PaaI-like protein
MSPRRLRRILNFWPPFLFSGIRVREITDDWSLARVELRQRWFNRNYVGSHFGGSLFAMTDPFWMIMLLHRLGRAYLVWDQAGEIEFRKPGRGTVHADLSLPDNVIAELRAAAAGGEKVLRWFETDVRDAGGEVVACVRKRIYVRLKREQRPAVD